MKQCREKFRRFIDEIKNLDFDKIFIANIFYNTLEETLSLGIPEEKIIIVSHELFDEYSRKNSQGKIKFALASVLTQKFRREKIIGEHIAEFEGNYFFNYDRDYVRAGTLQLLAREIHDRKILGDIAEFGVNQGFFAKYINELFPDRTLHLFDTFEGFDQKDELVELENEFVDKNTINTINVAFKNTSIDLVMSKMKNPDKIEIHKGYFPDTIPAEEKIFAFVSLDVDLYKPTFEGLKYFYPRLSIGGYIMIHDYNDVNCHRGIHQAVEDFEKEFGHIIKIPVIDWFGSLIVSK